MNTRLRPYLPFPEPLPPVPDENQGPFCLEIDGKWIPYLLGAVSALAIDESWVNQDYRSAQEARNLLALFASAKPCHIDAIGGVEVDDCMGCCLRWSEEGILQQFSCGKWVAVPGPGSTVPITGGSPAQGSPQPGPGDCEQFIGKVLFYGRWLLPVPVSTGDQITVSNALGAATDYVQDFPIWRCGDGLIFTAGGCVEGTTTTEAGDPAPTINHGSLIGYDGTNYYDFGQAANAENVTITIPPGITNQNFVMMLNFEGPAGAGDNTFDIRVCKQPEAPLSIAYTVGDGPLAASVGQIITTTFTDEGTDWGLYIVFSRCVKMSIVGVTDWDGVPGSNWVYWDCDNVEHDGPGSISDPVTQFPAHTCVTKFTIGSGHSSPGPTLQIKIEEFC